MNTTKILTDEIADITVASLPSRPTAPTSFGGRGYTAREMKAAFDRLPLFIIERFNMLLDDISSADEGSLSAEIPTDIYEGHTLRQLFTDIQNGKYAEYFTFDDVTLKEYMDGIRERIDDAEDNIEICFSHIADKVIDASSPSSRATESGEVKI